MYVQLDRDELSLLKEVVAMRVHELHPEIRRSMDYKFTDGLKQQLSVLEGLLRRFQEAEVDITA